ncbi:MAG: hypothetical protein MR806_03060, partial [Subdoligranulum sp.]|nr:hypothetical protein [Subdoligranulum sp.]
AHLCSIQYYLRFWLSICRTSLAVSALRIMRYCHKCNCLSRIGVLWLELPSGMGGCHITNERQAA